MLSRALRASLQGRGRVRHRSRCECPRGGSSLPPASYPLLLAHPRAVLPPVFSRAWLPRDETSSLRRHAQYAVPHSVYRSAHAQGLPRKLQMQRLRHGCCVVCIVASSLRVCRSARACKCACVHARTGRWLSSPPLPVHEQPSLDADMAAHAQSPYGCAAVHARTRMRTHA